MRVRKAKGESENISSLSRFNKVGLHLHPPNCNYTDIVRCCWLLKPVTQYTYGVVAFDGQSGTNNICNLTVFLFSVDDKLYHLAI